MQHSGGVTENNTEISAAEVYGALFKIQAELTKQIKADLSAESERLYSRLSREISSFQTTISNLKEADRKHEQNFERIEKLRRKNNVVLYGMNNTADLDQTGLLTLMRRLFAEKLGVAVADADVNNVYLVGRDRNIIKIEFVTFIKKVEVLKNAGKLKGTDIYLSDDLSRQERESQKILRQHLKLARAQKYSAYIRGTSLIVNGEKYTVEQLQSKPTFTLNKRSNSEPSTPNQNRFDGRDRLQSDQRDEVSVPAFEHASSKQGKQTEGEEGSFTAEKKVEKTAYSKEVEDSIRVLRSNSLDKKKNVTGEDKSDFLEKKGNSDKTLTPIGGARTRKIKGG